MMIFNICAYVVQCSKRTKNLDRYLIQVNQSEEWNPKLQSIKLS